MFALPLYKSKVLNSIPLFEGNGGKKIDKKRLDRGVLGNLVISVN